MLSRDKSELQRGVVRIDHTPVLQSNALSCTVYIETDSEKGNNRGASPNIVHPLMGVVTLEAMYNLLQCKPVLGRIPCDLLLSAL